MAQITHASKGDSYGKPGDQTNTEVYSRNFYKDGWTQLIRYPNENIRKEHLKLL